MPSLGQSGLAMNDNFDQHCAQTPSPSTGSRQATQSVGSALLRARQSRALKQRPVTFLLDRVAEDMAERLAAVKRDFADVADVWTPGDALRKPLGDRRKSFTHIDLRDVPREVLPFQPEQ